MVDLLRITAVCLVTWGYGGTLVSQVLAGGGGPAAGVPRSRFSLNTPTRKKASDGQEHP